MRTRLTLPAFVAAIALVASSAALAADHCGGEIRFDQGKSSTDLRGEVGGYDMCQYTFYAQKGQQLVTNFAQGDKPQAVLYSPMNVVLADDQPVTLDQSGKYELRVLLTRNDARKYSSPQPFTMHFAITGQGQSASHTEQHFNQQGGDGNAFAGTYAATLPCASCGGVDTKLALHKDGSYTLHENYLGRGQFTQHGSWMAYGHAIVLQPSGQKDSLYLIERDGDVFFSNQKEANAKELKVNPRYRLQPQ